MSELIDDLCDTTDECDGNNFGYECPRCGCSEGLAVRALIWTELSPSGSDPDGDACPDHDHDWSDDSKAYCSHCKWDGIVADLEQNEAQ